jgi:hypothetical protein
MANTIEKLLKKIKRNANKQDLHSFTANFNGGKVFVNYAYKFNITVFRFTKTDDIIEHYSFNLEDAKNFLENLGINDVSI